MAMSLGSAQGARAEINMTPLIDVLLVLLIIFMLMTPVIPQGLGVQLPRPNPVASSPPPERTIVVQVVPGGLRLNQDAVSEEDLGPRLVEIYKSRAERVCFIKGDPNLTYGEVAKVIDIIRGAGILTVGLLTTPL